jgi:hypothetical protein
LSTSKRRSKRPSAKVRKPANAGTAVAALDQVCWHLTCCDFLFDVIEAESRVGFHQLAADIEQALYHAEDLLHTTRPRSGRAGGAEGSTAALLVRRFEDQFDDDPPIVEDFTKGWPTCKDKSNGQPCSKAALYLGKGDWSAACENHASAAELDRKAQWRRGQDTAHRRAAQRPERRRRIGRALIDWWGGQTGAQDALQQGMLS